MNRRLIARRATQLKRKDQVLKVFELKFDKSHLNKVQGEFLNRLFLEAKWFFNYCIGCEKIKDVDTTAKTIPVMLRDGSFEERPIPNLAGQIKQGIQNRIFSNIKTLSSLKKKGMKVGRIRFASKVDSIPLKQHVFSHEILVKENLVRIAKTPKPFKVCGMEQIPKDAEFANAHLIRRSGDFFLNITCFTNKDEEYIQKQHKIHKNRKSKAVGLDFGCSTQLTGMTNENQAFKVEFKVPVNKSVKRLDRKIARKPDKKTPRKQRRDSKNRFKDKLKRQKKYQKLCNIKKDIRNKVVSCLTKNFETIVVQDENIKGWKKGGHGKAIQNTGIGGIMADLKNKSQTLLTVNRFFASTKTCSDCEFKKDKMEQSERIHDCPSCGSKKDRDVNAAKNILAEGLKGKIAREPSQSTLGENVTSTNNVIETLRGIAHVVCKPCSLNQEAAPFEAKASLGVAVAHIERK
jgi:transposase